MEALGDETVYSLAKRTGISESLIRKYTAGSSIPRADRAALIARALKVDLGWLVAGDVALWQAEGRHGAIEEGEGPWEDFALIPRYDIQASAGPGALVEDQPPASFLAFRRDWLRARGVNPHHAAVIDIKGDSMEGEMPDGSIALVDTAQHTLGGDGIYIIRSDGHLQAKRLQSDLQGGVIITSANPAYRALHFTADAPVPLRIIGKVLWVGHDI
jgi:phage repressor protein C with HTH and peptisase S24 domain